MEPCHARTEREEERREGLAGSIDLPSPSFLSARRGRKAAAQSGLLLSPPSLPLSSALLSLSPSWWCLSPLTSLLLEGGREGAKRKYRVSSSHINDHVSMNPDHEDLSRVPVQHSDNYSSFTRTQCGFSWDRSVGRSVLSLFSSEFSGIRWRRRRPESALLPATKR